MRLRIAVLARPGRSCRRGAAAPPKGSTRRAIRPDVPATTLTRYVVDETAAPAPASWCGSAPISTAAPRCCRSTHFPTTRSAGQFAFAVRSQRRRVVHRSPLPGAVGHAGLTTTVVPVAGSIAADPLFRAGREQARNLNPVRVWTGSIPKAPARVRRSARGFRNDELAALRRELFHLGDDRVAHLAWCRRACSPPT